jgi:hypothetical protein
MFASGRKLTSASASAAWFHTIARRQFYGPGRTFLNLTKVVLELCDPRQGQDKISSDSGGPLATRIRHQTRNISSALQKMRVPEIVLPRVIYKVSERPNPPISFIGRPTSLRRV